MNAPLHHEPPPLSSPFDRDGYPLPLGLHSAILTRLAEVEKMLQAIDESPPPGCAPTNYSEAHGRALVALASTVHYDWRHRYLQVATARPTIIITDQPEEQ